MSLVFAILLVVFSAIPTLAWGHGGGLDKQGCHRNRRQDDYHCHGGPLAGRTFKSKAQAAEALQGAGGPASPPRGNSPTPRPADTSQNAKIAAGMPYNRKMYGGWIDADGDCQNTRQEVLIAESLVPVTFNASGCRVLAGQWYDPFTGMKFTDPSNLDIDHFVPLAEVHRSGGAIWQGAKRRAYANDLSDPNTLIAVSASANRSKSDRDPADWLPPNVAYRCDYLRVWQAIKKRWGLALDAREEQSIKRVQYSCR